MDWTQIIIAALTAGFGVSIVKGFFERKGDVNQILRKAMAEMQRVHSMEMDRLAKKLDSIQEENMELKQLVIQLTSDLSDIKKNLKTV